MRITLEATGKTLALDLAETVRVLDEHTIEVDCPDDLGGGRMPVEAWQVLDLIQLGDATGLAEIGVSVDEWWKAWLEEAAAHCRMSVSSLVDVSVTQYVKAQGFEKRPPER